MSSFSLWHWLVVLTVVGVPILLIALVVGILKPQKAEASNTWKFRTIIYLLLAFFTSFLVVTIPIFLYLAYRSYVTGDAGPPATAAPLAQNRTKAEELGTLHALLQSGALTQREYDTEKKKLLETK